MHGPEASNGEVSQYLYEILRVNQTKEFFEKKNKEIDASAMFFYCKMLDYVLSPLDGSTYFRNAWGKFSQKGNFA